MDVTPTEAPRLGMIGPVRVSTLDLLVVALTEGASLVAASPNRHRIAAVPVACVDRENRMAIDRRVAGHITARLGSSHFPYS